MTEHRGLFSRVSRSRYPDLPAEWEVARIKDIAKVVGGSTPSRSEPEYWNGDILWATPTDISSLSGTTISDTKDKMTEKGLRSASTHVLPPYSVLMTSRATIGACAVNTVPMATNQGFQSLVPTDRVNTWYLFYRMIKARSYLESLGAGSTFSEVSKRVVEKVEIPVPPLSEQRKIASVLAAVDDAIQKTEAIIEQAKRVKRGVARRLFQSGYFDHEFKEQGLVKLPADWDFENLAQHTESSAFGPRFSSDLYHDEGNVGILRTTDLDKDGHINLDTMPRANLDLKKMEGHIVEEGDLLITRSGTTGIATVWPGHETPVIPGAFLIRFRLKDTLNPSFLKYYINSDRGGRRVERRAKGGVQKNLAGSDLLTMRFPVPTREEQDIIVATLSNLDDQIRHEKKHNAQLAHLKKGLMQDLLTGRVRTDDKDIDILDEVAAHG